MERSDTHHLCIVIDGHRFAPPILQALRFRFHLGLEQQQTVTEPHYTAPFEFTGRLLRVTVDMHEDQKLDGDGVGAAEMARR